MVRSEIMTKPSKVARLFGQPKPARRLPHSKKKGNRLFKKAMH
jgi:hypothetical protein